MSRVIPVNYRGTHGVLLGILGGRITATAYHDVVRMDKRLDPNLLQLARILTQ